MDPKSLRVEALTRHFRFGKLHAKVLAQLADLCCLDNFDEGDVIAFPGDAQEGPLFLVEGRIESREPGGRSMFFESGAVLGSEAYWKASVWPNLVRAKSSGAFLTLPTENFRYWAKQHFFLIQQIAQLRSPAEPDWTEDEVQTLRMKVPRHLRRRPEILEDDEIVRAVLRESSWFLALRWSLPLFFLFLSVGYATFLAQHPSLQILNIFPIVIGTSAVAVGFLETLAHRINYLLLTNRSVLIRQFHWSEKVFRLSKTNLEDIPTATIERKGWKEKIFGFCNVVFQTNRTREVVHGLPVGKKLEEVVAACGVSNRDLGKLSSEEIRKALENYFGAGRRPRRILSCDIPHKKPVGIWKIRRHLGNLLLKLTVPGGWLILLLIATLVALNLWSTSWSTILLLGAIGVLFPLCRIVWRILVWSNTYFEIADSKITLVRRKPFGLAEERREGDLAQVQEISVLQDSWSALFFDFGDLVVQLGTPDPLILEGASHPYWTQGEFFRRRDSAVNFASHREADQRADEIAKVLRIWDATRLESWFSKGS